MLRDLLLAVVAASLAILGSYAVEPFKYKYDVKRRVFEEKLDLYYEVNDFLSALIQKKYMSNPDEYIVDMTLRFSFLQTKVDLLYGNSANKQYVDIASITLHQPIPDGVSLQEYANTYKEKVVGLRHSLRKELGIE